MVLENKLLKVQRGKMAYKVNICLTGILLGVVFASPLPAEEILPKLQESWNKSRCSEFFAIDSSKAHFLAKKCSGKKGRWLRACIRSKNRGGHFDGILNNFVTFSEWKCYSAITTYYSNNATREKADFNLDNNPPSSSELNSLSQNTISKQEAETRGSATLPSSSGGNIDSDLSPDITNDESVPIRHAAPSLKDLVQIIDYLQKKVESLDKRIINLESNQR